ncbi:unannotated protein [freshwater metagenome]|uniref:Unannotated protein n=1 Tax=freshwater metagenome TaxID=449393 RepID=A0A6J7E8M1_9ZZZZ
MPAKRFAASRSPSTASPKRLMLSRTPGFFSFEITEPSFEGVASTMRWPTIFRNTIRAIGMTTLGRIGARTPPSRTATRMNQGKKAGTLGAILRNVRAATRTSSGRTTPSTNPTVNARPSGSLSTPASLVALTSVGNVSAAVSQRSTNSIASFARFFEGETFVMNTSLPF